MQSHDARFSSHIRVKYTGQGETQQLIPTSRANNMEPPPAECPFCVINDALVVLSETEFAIHDGYPVSPDHTLVIPRQHVATLFQLPRHEQLALWDLVERVRERLVEEHHPDGFNIGLNDGIAAGRTVPHVHIHVIPRYDGDVPDPRGGIRWMIPDKAPYWE